jgi:hypothetical protein
MRTMTRPLTFVLATAAAFALMAFAPDSAMARVLEDVPEIDPSVLQGALALAAGGVAVLADRLRRR